MLFKAFKAFKACFLRSREATLSWSLQTTITMESVILQVVYRYSGGLRSLAVSLCKQSIVRVGG